MRMLHVCPRTSEVEPSRQTYGHHTERKEAFTAEASNPSHKASVRKLLTLDRELWNRLPIIHHGPAQSTPSKHVTTPDCARNRSGTAHIFLSLSLCCLCAGAISLCLWCMLRFGSAVLRHRCTNLSGFAAAAGTSALETVIAMADAATTRCVRMPLAE